MTYTREYKALRKISKLYVGDSGLYFVSANIDVHKEQSREHGVDVELDGSRVIITLCPYKPRRFARSKSILILHA